MPFIRRKQGAPERERLAKRRKRRRMLLLTLLVIFCVLLVGLFAYTTHSPKAKVNKVTIVGTKELPVELIHTHVDAFLATTAQHVFAKDNALLLPRTEMEESLYDTFPRIKKVAVTTQGIWGPALLVEVTEREPYARWCSVEQVCFLMDQDGLVFAYDTGETGVLQSDFYGSLSTDAAIGQRYAPDTFAQLQDMTIALAQRGFVSARVVFIPEAKDVHFLLTRGFTVKAPVDRDPSETAATLDVVITSAPLRGKSGSLEYVDMRFENRVYYKFEGEPEIGTGD